MADTKHTPGPWSVFKHSWSDTSIAAPSFDHAICRLDINHATEESQESDEALMAANARLIAAAPELLQALQRAESVLRNYEAWAGLADECKRAIAKAVQP